MTFEWLLFGSDLSFLDPVKWKQFACDFPSRLLQLSPLFSEESVSLHHILTIGIHHSLSSQNMFLPLDIIWWIVVITNVLSSVGFSAATSVSAASSHHCLSSPTSGPSCRIHHKYRMAQHGENKDSIMLNLFVYFQNKFEFGPILLLSFNVGYRGVFRQLFFNMLHERMISQLT